MALVFVTRGVYANGSLKIRVLTYVPLYKLTFLMQINFIITFLQKCL